MVFWPNVPMVKSPAKAPKSIGLQQEPDPAIRSQARRPRDPDQPQLPFDPQPKRIEPCLAKLASAPPTGDEWAFEVKWDGYRLALHKDRASTRILTRNGHDWTERFPSLKSAVDNLHVSTVILDGEAVVLDDKGRSDFNALQNALGGRGGKKAAGNEVVFYAFDLLYFDGHDLTRMALDERRHMLEDLIGERGGTIRLSEEVDADGKAFFDAACNLGLEGIIAKRRDKPYRPGRNGDWLKIKCVSRETFKVIGYEASTKVAGAIANLMLAAQRGGELVYVGSVGTGFSFAQATELKAQLDKLKVSKPAAPVRHKRAVFVRPTLEAEIEFRAWTNDGKLRHASYKGMRDKADRGSVYKLDD